MRLFSPPLRAQRYSHELGHFASGTEESRRELAYSLAGETRRPAVGKYATATANAAEAHRTLNGEELKNRRNALYKQISEIEEAFRKQGAHGKALQAPSGMEGETVLFEVGR